MLPPAIPFIIAPNYQRFVETELLAGLDVDAQYFWQILGKLMQQFGPKQGALLHKRAELQQKLDSWYRQNPDCSAEEQEKLMRTIGYIVPEGDDFTITTENVDPEIAQTAGPQLVVPISNARYALNAANARYGSLYDALYGTDAMGSVASKDSRAQEVLSWSHNWLDETFPLNGISHAAVQQYSIKDAALYTEGANTTATEITNNLVGYIGQPEKPSTIILRNNGLHVLLHIDHNHTVGKLSPAGVADIELEAALSAIMDLEDSIAAVDSYEKVAAYRNLLGLLRGDLQEAFVKDGQEIVRELRPDVDFTDLAGNTQSLKRRAILWIRNVGHQMTNPTVRDCGALETYEGLLDAITTIVAGIHDIKGAGKNSAMGSIYVVKPKMHGPEEVTLTDDIFSFLEESFGLPQFTVKVGIMDEERRTSVNLKECIRAAKNRVAFINTGFLDRTGDEIHTAMHAGAFYPKDQIKQCPWITAYEARNVEIGLQCGLSGKAQIGKGMWAMPELMANMLEQKIDHLNAGASCAWVPSPTAATLHALHYHQIDVHEIQSNMAQQPAKNRLMDLLSVPLMRGENLSSAEILHEAENNAQSILGYVVRWVDQGVGCSKVPDINNIALMEDRATCRISSQLLANWLLHGVIDAEQMMATLRKMALVVDQQNADDASYTNMAPNFDGHAFQAAVSLVFQGAALPSGYTEPILHCFRRLKNSDPH